jgi:hypothetical protein
VRRQPRLRARVRPAYVSVTGRPFQPPDTPRFLAATRPRPRRSPACTSR